MIKQKQEENLEYFNDWGSLINAHVKLNPELQWKQQHSTRRRIFSPANGT